MKKTLATFLTVLLVFSFFFLFFAPVDACNEDDDCPRGQVCSQSECFRPLELTYPKIPGFAHETVVFTGLPQYVEYIFNFAIWGVGLILLGILIYNGVNYLTSAGSPSRLADAKKGILAGFIGVLILLGAGIIFNTIDPHLLTLDTETIDHVEPFQRAGVYICNYKVNDINDILSKYTDMAADVDSRIEAALRLRKVMGNVGDDQNCFRAVSASLAAMPMNRLDAAKEYTVFIVPERNFDDPANPWTYKHGIIFHEKERAGGSGKCEIFPDPSGSSVQKPDYTVYLRDNYYREISGHSVQLGFTSTRITVFKKTEREKGELLLYEGRRYDIESIIRTYTISGPSTDVKRIPKSALEQHELYRNIRSFDIIPRGEYLVVFKGRGERECLASTAFSGNLTAFPIGNCVKGTNIACNIGAKIISGDYIPGIDICEPCMEEVFFIRGTSI